MPGGQEHQQEEQEEHEEVNMQDSGHTASDQLHLQPIPEPPPPDNAATRDYKLALMMKAKEIQKQVWEPMNCIALSSSADLDLIL